MRVSALDWLIDLVFFGRLLLIGQEIGKSKSNLKKEKWTLSVDRRVKGAVIKEAKKLGIYPVEFIESLVREKFNPFGHSDVKDEAAYVRKLREADKHNQNSSGGISWKRQTF